MKFNITNKTWLTIFFVISTLMAVYLSFTETTYSLRHAVLDIEAILFLIASFFYKEEPENDSSR